MVDKNSQYICKKCNLTVKQANKMIDDHIDHIKLVEKRNPSKADIGEFKRDNKLYAWGHVFCRPEEPENSIGIFDTDNHEWKVRDDDILDYYSEPEDMYDGDKTWRLP